MDRQEQQRHGSMYIQNEHHSMSLPIDCMSIAIEISLLDLFCNENDGGKPVSRLRVG